MSLLTSILPAWGRWLALGIVCIAVFAGGWQARLAWDAPIIAELELKTQQALEREAGYKLEQAGRQIADAAVQARLDACLNQAGKQPTILARVLATRKPVASLSNATAAVHDQQDAYDHAAIIRLWNDAIDGNW
ncbi:hypothetical protein [Megalodesulfovibrio gigas]|uniref:Uncharacterized protein n=1 Tax=Megalodesulfovibrio gigas (strain ATCC 19364 / DSM 1382 / NCIMB 9332 / VKM B-1759) TaxID=1121448 RepID=T2GE05_MEGG1|nr:hypothetical protein [Megalodesulfovibrio gigas]AGW14117.1 hypothetical protein DGI_2365 [Megalodesulfovibrio gigas DSM 1382 = ATCC 19364]